MISIVYVGNDLTYFEGLKARFIAIESEEFEFKILWEEDKKKFQSLTKEIVESLPHVCLLDYSCNPKQMMAMARLLPRLFERGPSLIGLLDYHATTEQVIESKSLGIPFTHFKSPEYGDLVSQALFLHSDNTFPEGDFAKAETMKKPVFVEASSLFRIGYFTEKYVHVEHDFLPAEETELVLNNPFDESFPIERFKLNKRLDSNFYYEMSYVSNLSYVFSDNNKASAADDSAKVKKVKSQWNESDNRELVELRKKKIQTFINEQGELEASAKRTRLMVIDEEMNIVEQASRPLDSYPYSIRFYRSLHNKEDLVNRIKPGILCYQCPEGEEGELREIMEQVVALEGYKPFVIIFRSSWSSEYLQEHFNYARIISWNQPFDFNQLLSFCDTYETKDGREKSHLKISSTPNSFMNKEEKRFYISKFDSKSFMKYNFQIEIRSLCETWIKFQTKQELALWSILSIESPVPFDLTIIEQLDEKEWQRSGYIQYRAVIHGLGERERANMRKAVNKLIFDEVNYEKFLQEMEDDKLKREESKASREKDNLLESS